jgi:hypothetical protein
MLIFFLFWSGLFAGALPGPESNSSSHDPLDGFTFSLSGMVEENHVRPDQRPLYRNLIKELLAGDKLPAEAAKMLLVQPGDEYVAFNGKGVCSQGKISDPWESAMGEVYGLASPPERCLGSSLLVAKEKSRFEGFMPLVLQERSSQLDAGLNKLLCEYMVTIERHLCSEYKVSSILEVDLNGNASTDYVIQVDWALPQKEDRDPPSDRVFLVAIYDQGRDFETLGDTIFTHGGATESLEVKAAFRLHRVHYLVVVNWDCCGNPIWYNLSKTMSTPASGASAEPQPIKKKE